MYSILTFSFSILTNKSFIIAIYLTPLIFLHYSLLLFLFLFVFGDPASRGQRDVDVQDCHDNDREIECCYGRPKRHRWIRKELLKERKKGNLLSPAQRLFTHMQFIQYKVNSKHLYCVMQSQPT